MRFHLIPAAIAALTAMFATAPAQAANPAFALSFRFQPAFASGVTASPAIYLDVCGDAGCNSIVKSILMNCSVERVAATNAPAVVGCMVRVVSRPFYPDPNLALLTNTVNLRIRTDNMTSQVFSFFGGKPVVPETFYNFVITPGAQGFSVTPG